MAAPAQENCPAYEYSVVCPSLLVQQPPQTREDMVQIHSQWLELARSG
jgi:hypothetical protein